MPRPPSGLVEPLLPSTGASDDSEPNAPPSYPTIQIVNVDSAGGGQAPLPIAVVVDGDASDATTAFPAPALDELRKVAQVEARMMEDGWHVEDSPVRAIVAMVEEKQAREKRAERDQLRCKNCAGWFPVAEFAERPQTKDEDQALCHFHPGVYRRMGTTLSTGMFVGWSCCRNQNQDAPGCKHVTAHVEDTEMTKLLDSFGQDGDLSTSAMSQELDRRLKEIALLEEEEKNAPDGTPIHLPGMQEGAEEEEEEAGAEGDAKRGGEGQEGAEGTKKEAEGADVIVHQVKPSDTIQGVSLQYGVSAQRIKEVNGIYGSTIVQYSTLLIPTSDDAPSLRRKRKPAMAGRRKQLEDLMAMESATVEESLQTALYRKMCSLGGGSLQQAKAYLALADRDVDEALRMWKEDAEWEEGGGGGRGRFPGAPSCVEKGGRQSTAPVSGQSKTFFSRMLNPLRRPVQCC